jgi:GAF domain-containing protein
MTVTVPVEQVLGVIRQLAAELEPSATNDAALRTLTRMCLQVVSPADAAGITCVSSTGFESVAATSDLAAQVDQIQFDLGSGPCVDAAVEETIYRTDDLRSDPRWPEFGRRATEETGVRSMLSYRLFFEDDDDLAAALNVYSTKPDAFDDMAQMAGLAASTYGAELITSRRRRTEIAHLERALASNREIGAAIGVLMAQHRVTREQAFDLLRMASQNSHRKLVDIARDVVDTGTLGMS